MIYHHTTLPESLSSISPNITIKLKAITNVHSFVMLLFYTSQKSAVVKAQFFFQNISYHIKHQDRTSDDANIACTYLRASAMLLLLL